MKKDLATKVLTACPDVFSDICNVNLFGNEEFVHADELTPVPTETSYKLPNGVLRENRGDVRMRHSVSNTDIAIICLENQSDICNTMPIRDMGYIYAGYLNQIQNIKRENKRKKRKYYTKEIGTNQKLTPMISMVLYYGTDEWTGPTSVYDMLDIKPECKDKLESVITNYQINVISLATQSKETRSQYKSDFQHVVDYLAIVYKNDKKELDEFTHDLSRVVQHPVEFLDTMGAFTGDKRYQEVAENFLKESKEEGMKLCVMLDMIENRGVEQGMQQGINCINQLIQYLLRDNRMEDLRLQAEDSKFQNKLLKEYGLIEKKS